MKKILIIGAGIHGCFIAKYLKKHDVQIFLVEKNKNICEGTSASTHNRANRGFHYPRSKTTAFECKHAYLDLYNILISFLILLYQCFNLK